MMIRTKIGYMTPMEASCIGHIDKELARDRRKQRREQERRKQVTKDNFNELNKKSKARRSI
ncbi:hypothetical protein M5C72_02670 [Companilactobacillus allii]|uniref:hypothetical protein n=1 Tax=Companilactobacillus allii TaxID=1847728 RepID=UPI000F77DCAC|nr:hypothetical protein [Companilactobacillus allii]USQ69158.1 hypothetical protein M5C72_02670 [Companilactobacillus allii]